MVQIRKIQLNVVIQIDPSVEYRTKQADHVSYNFYFFFSPSDMKEIRVIDKKKKLKYKVFTLLYSSLGLSFLISYTRIMAYLLLNPHSSKMHQHFKK